MLQESVDTTNVECLDSFREYKIGLHVGLIQGVPQKMTLFEMQISPKIITRNQ